MRGDHAVLVEQRQTAGSLQHPLNHEHHVRAAGVILVEHQRDVVLHGPGQNAVTELGDLLAVLEDDRILADEIDTRHVAIEIDAHQRPVEPRGDLLDVGGFAGAMVPLHHDAPVEGEAGKDRQRGVAIEKVVGIDRRGVRIGLCVAHHLEVGIDAEQVAGGELLVRQVGVLGHCVGFRK